MSSFVWRRSALAALGLCLLLATAVADEPSADSKAESEKKEPAARAANPSGPIQVTKVGPNHSRAPGRTDAPDANGAAPVAQKLIDSPLDDIQWADDEVAART
jgi:hypothetical protein